MTITETVIGTMRRLRHYARPEFIWQESKKLAQDLEFKDVSVILENLFEGGQIEPFKRSDGRQFWRLKRKRCGVCGKEKPKPDGSRPPAPPRQYYCLKHRDHAKKTEYA